MDELDLLDADDNEQISVEKRRDIIEKLKRESRRNNDPKVAFRRSEKNKEYLRTYLKSFGFFTDRDPSTQELFVSNGRLQSYEKETVILDTVTWGRNNRHFYIVLTGLVHVTFPPSGSRRGMRSSSRADDEDGSGKWEYKYKEGDTFGEKCILSRLKKKGASFVSNALTETNILRIEWSDYASHFRTTHERLLKKIRKFLENELIVPVFQDFHEFQLLEVSKILRERVYQTGQVIIRQDLPGDEMYFILQGECRVLRYLQFPKGRIRYFHLATLRKGEYFGEMSLIKDERSLITTPRRKQSVVANLETKVLVLSKLYFTAFINSRKAESVLKNYARGYPSDDQIRKIFFQRKSWRDYKKNLIDSLQSEKSF